MKSRIFQVMVWSTISAAFIGPGTVTAALKAGISFKLELLWAIPFSILACFILQETVSRITISSGLSIGAAIEKRIGKISGMNIHRMLVFMIIFGCAAYQAGNLAGAAKGLEMVSGLNPSLVITVIVLVSFLLLYSGKTGIITSVLTTLVITMALLFGYIAIKSGMLDMETVKHLAVPSMPDGSSLLVIALIGTTIVPYNLFLGSSLSMGKDLSLTRIGLSLSIILGGLITVFVLLTGTLINDEFSFEAVKRYLEESESQWAGFGFSIGLFAAGFTSSLTAPLAAAFTFNSLSKKLNDQAVANKANRWIWMAVLFSGAAFALMNYDPVLVIILAQAFNGLILPFVAFYIYLIIHDKSQIESRYRNNQPYNALSFLVILITIYLGLFHLSGLLTGKWVLFQMIFPALVTAMIGIYLVYQTTIGSAKNGG